VGPYWVALGTALWGTESAFRIPLTEKGRFGKDGLYHSDVLVLIEHVFILGSFIPWIIANRATWPSRISLRAWIYVVISGICGSAIGTIFFTEALRVGNPTVVNLLLNIQPIISTLGGFVLFRERPGAHFLIWAPAALTAGLFLTTNPLEAGHISLLNKATIYTLICAFSWGLATVMGRGANKELPLPVASTLRIIVGLICMLTIVGVRNRLNCENLFPNESNWKSLGMLILLSTVSGGIPLVVYFRGLSRTPASIAGYFEMAQTLAAVVITWGLFGHGMNARQVVASLVLIFSVTMLQRDVGVAEGKKRNSY
jgi:drug/metabolite transporter (DMT)-like permease